MFKRNLLIKEEIKMKEDDKIGIKELSKKQYIPLKQDHKINNFGYIFKFTFVSIICVVIFLFFIYHINNRNNQLLLTIHLKDI